MISKNVKRILIILPLLFLLALGTGLLYWYNPNLLEFSKAREANQLVNLQQFDTLRNTFESDSGYVRLITQLSPT